MERVDIRNAEPSDYEPVILALNDWWGGRSMRDMLPRLFFVHFRRTSFVAQAENEIVGFLVGFISQTFPEEAYVHFIGVHPQFRRSHVGCALYQRLFSVAGESGCRVVRAVTGPANIDSVRFPCAWVLQLNRPTHVSTDFMSPRILTAPERIVCCL